MHMIGTIVKKLCLSHVLLNPLLVASIEEPWEINVSRVKKSLCFSLDLWYLLYNQLNSVIASVVDLIVILSHTEINIKCVQLFD